MDYILSGVIVVAQHYLNCMFTSYYEHFGSRVEPFFDSDQFRVRIIECELFIRKFCDLYCCRIRQHESIRHLSVVRAFYIEVFDSSLRHIEHLHDLGPHAHAAILLLISIRTKRLDSGLTFQYLHSILVPVIISSHPPCIRHLLHYKQDIRHRVLEKLCLLVCILLQLATGKKLLCCYRECLEHFILLLSLEISIFFAAYIVVCHMLPFLSRQFSCRFHSTNCCINTF